MFSSTQPLVSVVIPAYNAMAYLKAAIESVLNQDYPHIELIVLDDGSTDQTAQILKQYEGVFHFESHDNMGQAATLNKGWKRCKGEIIGYLSADDLLTAEAISLTVKAFLQNPDTILTYGDNLFIDSQSKILGKFIAPAYEYHDFVSHAKCRIGVGSFFLKKAFELAGGWNPNYRVLPDYDFQLRMARLGPFKHLSSILGHIRIHPEAISVNKKSAVNADEYISIMKNELSTSSDSFLLQRKNKILSRSYLFAARAHWDSGRYRRALRYLGKTLRLDPYQLLHLDLYKTALNAVLKIKRYAKFKNNAQDQLEGTNEYKNI